MPAPASAVRIPMRSAKLVKPRPANGIIPTKASMKTAETRPRKWSGARSCTIVLAKPKLVATPSELTTSMAIAT